MSTPARGRGLKPRQAPEYDSEKHNRRGSSLSREDRTIDPDIAPINLIKPQHKKGPLIFRPAPQLDYNHPETTVVPGRKTIKTNSFSHFGVRVEAAKFVGLSEGDCERCTFILWWPWQKDDQTVRNNNPFMVLYRNAANAKRQGFFAALNKDWNSRWNILMEGTQDKGKALPSPGTLAYLQGDVFCNGERDYTIGEEQQPLGYSDKDPLNVIQLSGDSWGRMLELYERPKANELPAEITDVDPWKQFVFGDPTGIPTPDGGLSAGPIVAIFNAKMTPKVKIPIRQAGRPTGRTEEGIRLVDHEIKLAHTSWDGKPPPTISGYEAALLPSFKSRNGQVYPAAMDKDRLDMVRSKLQFWFPEPGQEKGGLLRVPSMEEQCVLLAKAFKAVPDLLRFCWDDHREFFNDEVEGILNDRKVAARPDGDYATDETGEGTSTPMEENPRAAARGSAPTRPARTDPAMAAKYDAGFGDDDTTTGDELPVDTGDGSDVGFDSGNADDFAVDDFADGSAEDPALAADAAATDGSPEFPDDLAVDASGDAVVAEDDFGDPGAEDAADAELAANGDPDVPGDPADDGFGAAPDTDPAGDDPAGDPAASEDDFGEPEGATEPVAQTPPVTRVGVGQTPAQAQAAMAAARARASSRTAAAAGTPATTTSPAKVPSAPPPTSRPAAATRPAAAPPPANRPAAAARPAAAPPPTRPPVQTPAKTTATVKAPVKAPAGKAAAPAKALAGKAAAPKR